MLLIVAGAVILVDHALSPALPGQAPSGSITESKEQLIEEQLAEAVLLNNEGKAVPALQLYNKVLAEDPDDPVALAASGWLEWNYGSAGKSPAIIAAGRKAEEKAMRLAPTYWAGQLFLGLILFNQDHNATGAVGEFTNFLADSPPKEDVASCGPAGGRRLPGGEGAASRRAGGCAGGGDEDARHELDDHDDLSPVAPAVRPRRRRTAVAKAAMSASVVDQPTETRSEWLASTPIASSTGDGSMLSDEHAEPEWTATPGPVEADQDGLGLDTVHAQAEEGGQSLALPVVGPTISTPSTAVAAAERAARCRRAWPASRGAGVDRRRRARRRPPRRPRSAGIASSPARRARSCSPPTMSGSNRLPRRMTSAPAPGRPPILWALRLTRSAPRSPRSMGTCPQAAAASTWTGTPAARQMPTIVVHRLHRSHLVVGPLAVHQRRARPVGGGQALLQRVAVDPRRAVDRDGLGRRQPGGRLAHGGVLHLGEEHGCARVLAGRPPHGRVDRPRCPPEVKTISRGVAQTNAATCRRASSSRSRTTRPSSCSRPGSAAGVAIHASTAASASGRGGVVLA